MMTAEDSAARIGRITASKKPFHECTGYAFQTCGSGETAARLSLDGTAYGVLISVADRTGAPRPIFLWRLSGRVGMGGLGDDEEGGGGRGGGGKPKRSRSRKGG
ncbi:MAG: hypothetical protein ABI836_12160 [Gemmatimonadota bacterium]